MNDRSDGAEPATTAPCAWDVTDASISNELPDQVTDLREVEEFARSQDTHGLILLPVEVTRSSVDCDDEVRARGQRAFQEAVVGLVTYDVQFRQRVALAAAVDDLGDELRMITDADKVRFVARVAPSFPRERLPRVAVGIGARRRLRMFPDDVLIGVDATDAPVFVCVVTTPYEEELVGVFQRHGDLLGALPRWTFRLMFPPHLAIGMGRYQVAFRSAVAEPYSSRIVDEMR